MHSKFRYRCVCINTPSHLLTCPLKKFPPPLLHFKLLYLLHFITKVLLFRLLHNFCYYSLITLANNGRLSSRETRIPSSSIWRRGWMISSSYSVRHLLLGILADQQVSLLAIPDREMTRKGSYAEEGRCRRVFDSRNCVYVYLGSRM